MKINVRGNNIDVTEALRDFVEKKVSRLEKYFDDASSAQANVALSVQRDEHKVEVTIPFPRLLVRAEETSEDMYASVDLVVQKLERQIRKYKTRVNRKARQNGSLRSHHMNGTTVVEEKDETGWNEEPPIVRTKRFNLKPMDIAEAVLQMDLLGHNFFVFTNSVTNRVNVVYKRKDGQYGLIEPE